MGNIMKKKMLKKIVLAVCIAALAVTSIGCGDKEKTSDGGLEKVTIWTGDSHMKTDMLELVEKFNDTRGKELGVEIEYVVKEGNLSQTVEMAVASHQEPDMYSTWSMQKYYESGEIMAIDEIEGGQEYLDSLPEEALSSLKSKVNGKYYTVPYYINTFGIAYNVDMLKKNGFVDAGGNVVLPETFEELRAYAKKMTNEKAGEYGFIFPLKDGNFYQNSYLLGFPSNGTAGYDHKTGKYNYETLEPAIQLLLDIKNDKSIYPDAEGLDNDSARALFAEGKIGMIFAGSYDVAVFTKQFPAKCEWTIGEYPVQNKDEKYKHRISGGGGLVINREMYERLGAEKTLEIYKWFHGEEVLRELYKRGCAIPKDVSIIENVKPNDNVHESWGKFGELLSISYAEPARMPTDLEGTADFKTMFQTDFWGETGSLSEGLADLSRRSNAGIDKKLQATNGKREAYIDVNYDVKR